jgi:dihydrofolate reductase
MRKLTYFVASSLDGFIAAPDGSFDFFGLPDDVAQFLVSEYPETLPTAFRTQLGLSGEGAHFDTVLEGRASYQVGLDAGVTNAYAHLRHLVFSTTLTVSDPSVEVVASDALGRVRQLKGEPGSGIWLVGGGRLAAALVSEIDEFVIKLNPVIAGAGIPLLASGFDPQALDFVETRMLESGVVVLTYRRL